MEKKPVNLKDIIDTGSDDYYESLLAERGGRISYAFFRIRAKLGKFFITATEESREDIIAYHEDKRKDPKGILWDHDYPDYDPNFDRLLR